jgi:hypothetical protein
VLDEIVLGCVLRTERVQKTSKNAKLRILTLALNTSWYPHLLDVSRSEVSSGSLQSIQSFDSTTKLDLAALYPHI